jgi:hypothetical protein
VNEAGSKARTDGQESQEAEQSWLSELVRVLVTLYHRGDQESCSCHDASRRPPALLSHTTVLAKTSKSPLIAGLEP